MIACLRTGDWWAAFVAAFITNDLPTIIYGALVRAHQYKTRWPFVDKAMCTDLMQIYLCSYVTRNWIFCLLRFLPLPCSSIHFPTFFNEINYNHVSYFISIICPFRLSYPHLGDYLLFNFPIINWSCNLCVSGEVVQTGTDARVVLYPPLDCTAMVIVTKLPGPFTHHLKLWKDLYRQSWFVFPTPFSNYLQNIIDVA